MPRNIVFFGNCQAQALSLAYDAHIGRPAGEKCTFLASYEDDPAARAAVAAADTAVIQIFDFPSKVDADLPGTVTRIFFPSISAGYLWPFGYLAHPRNAGVAWLDSGPYPPQLGEGYLNNLIAKGVPAEEAVARYLALDVPAQVDLDRLYELAIDRQKRRDARTGIATAPSIEAWLRETQIFLTADHPTLRLWQVQAEPVFAQLGVAPRDIAAIFARLRHAPFPQDELPIHPSVARHFGLRYADETTRYRYLMEGAYTFAEFIRRYAAYEWNETLMRGIHLSHGADAGFALRILEAGLAASPGSLTGQCRRAELLVRLGRHAEAAAQARQTAATWPAEPEAQICLADTLRASFKPAEAVDAARAALAAAPQFASAYRCLADALLAAGHQAAAIAAANRASRLEPGNAHLAAARGHMLLACGRPAEAEAAFAQAIFLDREEPDFHAMLTHARRAAAA